MKKHVDNIVTHFKKYVCTHLDALAMSDPTLAIMRPIVSRIINNKMPQVEEFLKQIADKEGMIDIDSLFDEMLESIMNINVIKTSTEGFGDMELGNGKLSFMLPLINKKIVMDKHDLIDMKQLLMR